MKKCGWFWTSFLLLMSTLGQAGIVDTYQFKNSEDRVRAVELAKSLRCPQCQNQNLVESNSPIAHDLRIEVYKMVDEGQTNQQIIDSMTARFGHFVLYKPPFQWTTLILWGLPFALLLFAVGLMVRYARRHTLTEMETESAESVVEQQQALQQLLKQVEQKEKEK
ncbi:heme lyase NrfEFG subunit NrfF [Pasteurella oralis]|uniref:Formate-dependent nitrite reductase complex subunit n=1 Tax=Pasteurella oralis TaxID=1071947 RepID=A0ABW4NY31_9PAST